jgi:eukaryotic-like serine/threonine-protein kinase
MTQSLSEFTVEQRDPLVGTVLAGRYRILRKIGDGGMGAVYEAEHAMLGRRVAVKVLRAQFAHDAEVVRRFMNEARAAAMLAHRNIIECTDVGQHDDGSPFLVLSFLEGRSLADDIAEHGPLPIGRAVRIVTQICAALSAAHAKGIVHRDMKPDNVFLETGDDLPPDHVRVLDFGISKFSSSATMGGTKTGSMLGTPFYMSPEQISDSSKVDHRTDVYSVGAILFELLAGGAPFQAATFPGLVMKIVGEPLPEIREVRPDVPEALGAVIRRAMAKSADHRIESMAKLAEALAPFASMDEPPEVIEAVRSSRASETPIQGSPPGAAVEFDDTMLAASGVRGKSEGAAGPRRARLGIALGAVALLLGGVAIWAGTSRGTEPTREEAPAGAAPAAEAPAEAPPVAPKTVKVQVTAPHDGAFAVVRGTTYPLPCDVEIEAGTAPELVEVGAPEHVSRRYGVNLGESRTLYVQLDRGRGVRVASDAELAVALLGVHSDASEPPSVSAPVEATPKPARRAARRPRDDDPPPLLLPR